MATAQSNAAAIFGGEYDHHQPARIAMPQTVALLSAAATVMRDTIERFAEVSGRVTETVLSRGDAADAGLIVTLQDFDRLQQEFSALSDVFSSCVGACCAPTDDDQRPHDPIAEITLADLKGRLSNRVHNESVLMASRPVASSEDVF